MYFIFFIQVSSECSGRSLASLLIAWVSAAMVASVLLRWKYMWIALAVLTLLFFLACGYTACTNCQRTEAQIIPEDTINIQHQRQHIQSIYGDINRFPENYSQTVSKF